MSGAVFGAVWLQLRVSQENLQPLCCTDVSTEGFQCRAGRCKPLVSALSTFLSFLTASFTAQARALMNIMCPPHKWGGSLRSNEDSFLFHKLGGEGAAKLPPVLPDLAGGLRVLSAFWQSFGVLTQQTVTKGGWRSLPLFHNPVCFSGNRL